MYAHPRTSSRPSIRGMCKSVMIGRQRPLRAQRSPSAAYSIFQSDALLNKPPTRRRSIAESSTTSTVVIVRDLVGVATPSLPFLVLETARPASLPACRSGSIAPSSRGSIRTPHGSSRPHSFPSALRCNDRPFRPAESASIMITPFVANSSWPANRRAPPARRRRAFPAAAIANREKTSDAAEKSATAAAERQGAYSGTTVTSSRSIDSTCAAAIESNSSAKPINRARSQSRLIRRGTPCERLCTASRASSVKKSRDAPAIRRRCPT